mgnify:CR=1 FL=1
MAEIVQGSCPTCGLELTGKSEKSLKMKMGIHQRQGCPGGKPVDPPPVRLAPLAPARIDNEAILKALSDLTGLVSTQNEAHRLELAQVKDHHNALVDSYKRLEAEHNGLVTTINKFVEGFTQNPQAVAQNPGQGGQGGAAEVLRTLAPLLAPPQQNPMEGMFAQVLKLTDMITSAQTTAQMNLLKQMELLSKGKFPFVREESLPTPTLDSVAKP